MTLGEKGLALKIGKATKLYQINKLDIQYVGIIWLNHVFTYQFSGVKV